MSQPHHNQYQAQNTLIFYKNELKLRRKKCVSTPLPPIPSTIMKSSKKTSLYEKKIPPHHNQYKAQYSNLLQKNEFKWRRKENVSTQPQPIPSTKFHSSTKTNLHVDDDERKKFPPHHKLNQAQYSNLLQKQMSMSLILSLALVIRKKNR